MKTDSMTIDNKELNNVEATTTVWLKALSPL